VDSHETFKIQFFTQTSLESTTLAARREIIKLFLIETSKKKVTRKNAFRNLNSVYFTFKLWNTREVHFSIVATPKARVAPRPPDSLTNDPSCTL